MLQLFRLNVGLAILTGVLAAGIVVCLLIGFIMHKGGASLRPIIWFAAFFGIVALPQFFFHLSSAIRLKHQDDRHRAGLEILASGTASDQRRAAATSLFGAEADPDLVRDIRSALGGALDGATQSGLATYRDGSTALIARFPSASAAVKGWSAYLQAMGVAKTGKGDSARGYSASRQQGDRLYALPTGATLVVFTADSDQVIRRRATEAGIIIPGSAHLDGTGGGRSRVLIGLGLAVGLPALVVAAAMLFFRGSSWSASSPATAGVPVLSESDLEARLLAINQLNVPFSIEATDRKGEFIATWKYADARWIDFAKAHGMRRTHRIRLRIDPSRHAVLATDSTAEIDWSAGVDGARLRWKSEMGIVLFHREHKRVFGLQLDPDGKLKPELSYAYTFNLEEMKGPLTQAVNRAGWNWRPVAWDAPTWLRWLTG